MQAKHKTMLFTVVAVLVALAMINNVSALNPLKEQINGKSGWF
ncbi:hypothetical protein BCU66_023035 [Vibrio sp. 10N.286.49.B1]|nr:MULTISPECIES: hypothetical protein [unclassified Vibrio]